MKSQSARPRKWRANRISSSQLPDFQMKKIKHILDEKTIAVSVDRTRDLQIFSLTLSQLSYPRLYAQIHDTRILILRSSTTLELMRRSRRGAGSGGGGPPPHPPQLRLRPGVLRRHGHPNPCGNHDGCSRPLPMNSAGSALSEKMRMTIQFRQSWHEEEFNCTALFSSQKKFLQYP